MEFFELIDYLYNETVNGNIEWYRYETDGYGDLHRVCTKNQNVILTGTHAIVFGAKYSYSKLQDESFEKLRYMINQVNDIQVVSDRIKKLVMTQEL